MPSLPSSFNVTVLLSILLSLTLSGCGFHLRGDYDIPEELNKISLTSYDEYSLFTRFVKSQLTLNKVELVQVGEGEDVANLHLRNESITTRTLSLYQTSRAAEKEITFRTSYSVTVPNKGARTFTTSVTRSYLENPLAALAKSVELSMIEDEMRKLAATQIIRQLARLQNDLIDGELEQRSDVDPTHPSQSDLQYDVETYSSDNVPQNGQTPELIEQEQESVPQTETDSTDNKE
ncbi:LPS assembly lipoprotein LptE [Vibrio sp.]|nr:LPS assembly lipoprotein LptE [Vibrio sp.]